jgi:integrase
LPNLATGKTYWQEEIQKRHITAAAMTAGLTGIGWHTFRHTYRTLLDETGAPMKVQQELMRRQHSDDHERLRAGSLEYQALSKQRVVQMVLKPAVPVQTNEKGADVAAP